jgi:hypothetical protein
MKSKNTVPTGMDLFKPVNRATVKSQSFAEPNAKTAGARDAQMKKKSS